MEQLVCGAEQPAAKPMTADEDISPEEMAAYIDDCLSVDERASVEARLARSPELREELVAVSRIRAAAEASTPRRPSPWKVAGILLAAAAALTLVVALPNGSHDVRKNATPAERRVEAEDGGHVVLMTPGDAGMLDPASPGFAWRSEGDASYRITVADGSGATVWTTLTKDTSASLPPTILLHRGNNYYWYVDALRSDGSSVSSGPRSFKISAR